MDDEAGDGGPDLLDLVRARCAEVAERSTWVTVDLGRIEPYARTLVPAGGDSADGGRSSASPSADPWVAPIDTGPARGAGATGHGLNSPEPDAVEAQAALVVALDAVNFGSGYHDHVVKLPGLSGARTMATRLRSWAEDRGGIRADHLVGLDRAAAHRIFGQPETEPLVELMGLFAVALDELGRTVAERYGGSFTELVASAGGSAARLVATLAALPTYADVSTHRGVDVPFLKRAQVTAADLHRAFGGVGPGRFDDLNRLTAFADNLVPHVLRLDGVLHLDTELEAAIDRGELLIHGDEPEVELRACGVHAVELLGAACAAAGRPMWSADIDQVLWTRGGESRYKAVRRPRSRTTAY